MLTASAKIEFERICQTHLENLRYRVNKYAEDCKMHSREKAQHIALTYGAAQVRLNAIKDWFAGADLGSRASYFAGADTLAQARESSLALDCVASTVRALADAGYVWLEQSRNPTGVTTYSVKRSRKGFIPALAKAGIAGSTPSAKFNGTAPHVETDGRFTIPGRRERQDGAPRPTLTVYDHSADGDA